MEYRCLPLFLDPLIIYVTYLNPSRAFHLEDSEHSAHVPEDNVARLQEQHILSECSVHAAEDDAPHSLAVYTRPDSHNPPPAPAS